MTPPSSRLSVCCFPLSAGENRLIDILYRPLATRGVHLVAYDWFLATFAAVDVFHVHWPDAVVMGSSRVRILIKFIAFLFSVAVFRLRGVVIVYSVHNIRSHEGRHRLLEDTLWRFFLPRVSTFVHMNSDSVKTFVAVWPEVTNGRHVVVPLPHFKDEAAPTFSRKDARRAFDGDDTAFTVLAFGLVRPYKGLEDLIAAFRQWSARDARLAIVGRALDANYAESLCVAALGDPRIEFDFRFLDEQELAKRIVACDLVALAYRKLNNSGVALQALSLGRPILAPRLGAMADLATAIGVPWVQLFDGAISADALALARTGLAGLGEDQRPDLGAYDPEVVADGLEATFLEARARGRPTQRFAAADG
jgi:beta-1,4-mannosyltransferase